MSQANLQVGDQVRCPLCAQFHKAHHHGSGTTEYANAMLYVTCGTDLIYVGQIGSPCRHEVRKVKSMRRLVLILSLCAIAAAGYDLWLYNRYVPLAVNQPPIREPYTTVIFDKSYPERLRICENVDRRGSVWWAPRPDGFCYGEDQPRRTTGQADPRR